MQTWRRRKYVMLNIGPAWILMFAFGNLLVFFLSCSFGVLFVDILFRCMPVSKMCIYMITYILIIFILLFIFFLNPVFVTYIYIFVHYTSLYSIMFRSESMEMDRSDWRLEHFATGASFPDGWTGSGNWSQGVAFEAESGMENGQRGEGHCK